MLPQLLLVLPAVGGEPVGGGSWWFCWWLCAWCVCVYRCRVVCVDDDECCVYVCVYAELGICVYSWKMMGCCAVPVCVSRVCMFGLCMVFEDEETGGYTRQLMVCMCDTV
ncbi:hypothetical protein Dimus_038596 [Dionaea muscipula]